MSMNIPLFIHRIEKLDKIRNLAVIAIFDPSHMSYSS